MISKLLVFAVVSLSLFPAAFGQRVITRTGRVVLVEPVAGGYLGVQAKEITKKNFADYDLREVRGVAVDSVLKNSPADKAGIKAGDVITEADGKAIKTTADLIDALGEKKEGDVILTIVRGKNRQTLKVMPEASRAAPTRL